MVEKVGFILSYIQTTKKTVIILIFIFVAVPICNTEFKFEEKWFRKEYI